ncbi:unnamed protein product (macronuclear) [Paramecium tetraurelia]|uniref:PX domain-containing protein n=1 Tax=Paramecium tetraurelia TaxID=5888 RepID=A0BXP9_PARTE|nr:uncharacterized protein GSPATT00033169001 [Paramecium tetraurelia]CAK63316.1 unnamed protein product [Paramecium tetraurelia]|eukprot:XP_001430714.1 hypothetical protein (macronuclear) [Paramecium tetraurelia strain d4-2]
MHKMTQRFIIEIPEHEYMDGKVFYLIRTTNIENNCTKEVRKRYSELELIHLRILDWINIFKIQIPLLQFPKKKILFSTNISEESVIKRRLELQIYLNEIFQHQDLYGLGALQEFLPIVKNPNIQESKNAKSNINWQEIEELKKSYLAKHESEVISLTQSKLFNQNKQQYTFKFEDHKIQDHSAIYMISINDQLTGKNWKFSQRYKDLREYHHQLKKLKLQFELPEFPEKKFIKLDDDSDLSDRKRDLENYLNQIFKYPELVQSDVMVFFIAKSQLYCNEIGCRSNDQAKNTLQFSRIKSKSNITSPNVEQESKVPRKITC